MAASTTFTYKTDASAGDIPAIVHYMPATSDKKPRRAVMVVHAGGYTMGGTWLIPRTQIDALLDLGFVVITPEYRLAPQVSVYEGPVTDVRDCLAWTRATLPNLLQAAAGVSIDPAHVGAMGHSAGGNLSLLLGSELQPPTAILNIFGPLYLDRPFHHQPLPAFASLPETPQEFRDKVYEGPVQLTAPAMMTREGKPDLSSPRSAFMLEGLKTGNLTAQIVKDGDYAKVDSAKHFHKDFPPTAVLHGTKDIFAPFEYAEEAVQMLQGLGVNASLIAVPDQSHMFDLPLKRDDELFKYIQQGLDFLNKYV